MELEDNREAPWTVTDFFLDPRRYNPSADILHKAANVSPSSTRLAALFFCVCLVNIRSKQKDEGSMQSPSSCMG